jgi:hypothetical protein
MISNIKIPNEDLAEADLLETVDYDHQSGGLVRVVGQLRPDPLRPAYDDRGGLQIELGTYNLGKRELRVLYRAINLSRVAENESRRLCSPAANPPRCQG